MDDHDLQHLTGWIASIARDMCAVPEHLDKNDYKTLAKAMANIALAASAFDGPLIDTRDDDLASEAAHVVRSL